MKLELRLMLEKVELGLWEKFIRNIELSVWDNQSPAPKNP